MGPSHPAAPNTSARSDESNEDERGELRDQPEGAPAEWGRAWNDELGRRVGEIERGEAKLLTEEEFFADDESR